MNKDDLVIGILILMVASAVMIFIHLQVREIKSLNHEIQTLNSELSCLKQGNLYHQASGTCFGGRK